VTELDDQLARAVLTALRQDRRLAENIARELTEFIADTTGGWLPAAAAAEYAGVSVDTLERAVRDGTLTVAQPRGRRGHRLFERVELDRWIRGR
jgi:excisionase family DNA binding protein